MHKGRDADKALLDEMPREKERELFFLQMRNLWAVDGLYFLGIEERFGTDAATDIDAKTWEVMGKLEARGLKAFLNITGSDIESMMRALRHTSWSLDLEHKEIEVGKDRGVFRNTNCRVQNTRLKKGLSEFPCKKVRWGYLKAFAKEFNPDIEVMCRVCPPDKHADNLWCEWEFGMRNK